ncbi:hypothetical protein O3M35_004443 [Rhynocoris fuscipes]|uniref:Meckelin n=1 Tax=Rhynocoris fuscipes TaxID=488301 RepID=A0AAW1CHQ8_9HEMI
MSEYIIKCCMYFNHHYGNYEYSNISAARCLKCDRGSIPSDDHSKCIWCNPSLPLCACTNSLHFECPSKLSWNPSSQIYRLDYGGIQLDSVLLRKLLPKSALSCKFNDSISCQVLANLCVLNLYIENGFGPCKILKESMRNKIPWLYYPDGEASTILGKVVHPKFTMDLSSETSHLKIIAHSWQINGSWLGKIEGLSEFEFCQSYEKFKPGRFAVDYLNNCYFDILKLYKFQTVFYDLYLEYKSDNKSFLQPIPILMLDYKRNNKLINKVHGISQWQLTRRFFIVDNIGGYKNGEPFSMPSVIRYLKSARLSIRIRNSPNEGEIYTPLMTLSYGLIRNEDLESNKKVKISFKIQYSMSDNVKRHSDLAMAILCSATVLWSFMRAWSETRRSGQRPVDLVALVRLAIIAAGHLSNVFFVVAIGLAIHSWAYYKYQAVVHVILPSSRLIYLVTVYIIVAFPLKLVEVAVMLWRQSTVDIFLIDWEHPRLQKGNSPFVSAWRTYFVANKWHDLQTMRKTNVILQLAATIIILKVFGVEYWAVKEPELNRVLDERIKYIDFSIVYRIAVLVCLYVAVYITQWTFINLLYDRYIRNCIQEFVDICSLANISIFILLFENYGFYIHGRSAHGFSDTDMATLRKQLRREEEDLVGHRGLVPASDHQTFTIVIPSKLRLVYTSLINNVLSESIHFPFRKQSGKHNGGDIITQSYITINRFLAAFIEHALKDLDYEVRDREFLEALFDIDIYDSNSKGVFFNDNGHSFDNVLFYGNEFVLFTFNLVVFCFFEIFFQNYLISAVITGLFDKAITAIKRFGSRKNFAKKTLIDKNFLP